MKDKIRSSVNTSFKLIVTSRFGKYKKGDVISDPDEVDNVLKSANKASVVKVHKKVGE